MSSLLVFFNINEGEKLSHSARAQKKKDQAL